MCKPPVILYFIGNVTFQPVTACFFWHVSAKILQNSDQVLEMVLVNKPTLLYHIHFSGGMARVETNACHLSVQYCYLDAIIVVILYTVHIQFPKSEATRLKKIHKYTSIV